METLKVKAGAAIASIPVDGTSCIFTTSYDVDVHPLQVTNAVLDKPAGSAAGAQNQFQPHRHGPAVLEARTVAHSAFRQLRGRRRPLLHHPFRHATDASQLAGRREVRCDASQKISARRSDLPIRKPCCPTRPIRFPATACCRNISSCRINFCSSTLPVGKTGMIAGPVHFIHH